MLWLWQKSLLSEMFLSTLYSCIWILNSESWDSKDDKEDSEWEQRLHKQDKKDLINEEKEEEKQEELTSIEKHWKDWICFFHTKSSLFNRNFLFIKEFHHSWFRFHNSHFQQDYSISQLSFCSIRQFSLGWWSQSSNTEIQQYQYWDSTKIWR